MKKTHHPVYTNNYEKTAQEGTNRQWITTFADLLSLILTFFVLLYSMSTLEAIKWQEIVASLSQKLNPNREVDYAPPAEELSVETINQPDVIDLDYLATITQEKFLSNKALSSTFVLQQLEDRIIISLVGKKTFTSGLNRLTPEGAQAIAIVGDLISNIGNHINVYGNASPEPINTAKFPSNWELSLSRALVVSQLLRKKGYEYKITSFGRAHANYDELKNVAKDKREELSRRIDIVIRSYGAEL